MDIYRNGNVVMLAKTGRIACPYTLINRYIRAAGSDLSSQNLSFFAHVAFLLNFMLPLLQEAQVSPIPVLVLDAFSQLGFCTKLFCLHHILSSWGATAAANAGVNDSLFNPSSPKRSPFDE